ncbi:MAG: hypothetical protein ABI537_11955 [Casimicrobiaceae bacterium]
MWNASAAPGSDRYCGAVAVDPKPLNAAGAKASNPTRVSTVDLHGRFVERFAIDPNWLAGDQAQVNAPRSLLRALFEKGGVCRWREQLAVPVQRDADGTR